MAHINHHPPGTFCWCELATTDPGQAKQFYQELFGWASSDFPIGGDSWYTMLKLEDRELGALYRLLPEQERAGVHPHWLLYVAVSDADGTADSVRAAGGKILAGPFEVGEAGRMALFEDPQGATFAVWQAKSHPGARVHLSPGTLCWPELATTDAPGSRTFYGSVFGWESKISPIQGVEYTEWSAGGQPVGGMLQMTEEWGEVPPHWLPYFRVQDCENTSRIAAGGGGQVLVPPTEVPGVGHFAFIRDPQGAVFAILQLAELPTA